MPLNWLEQLAADFFRLRKYLVQTNVNLPLKPGRDRTVGGHSDIDVLAANGAEVVHCECQTNWVCGPSEDAGAFRRLEVRYESGRKLVQQQWPFLLPRGGGIPYRRVFVVGGRPKRSKPAGPYARLDRWAKAKNVEVRDLDTLIEEYREELKIAYPDRNRVGKEEGQAGLLHYLQRENWLDN